jgi:predicted RNase H-like HicB family nuclease
MGKTTASITPITEKVTVAVTAVIRPEPDAGGYSAEIPAFPGCYTQGETLEEVRANLKEAAEGWLSSVHDHAVAGASRGARP